MRRHPTKAEAKAQLPQGNARREAVDQARKLSDELGTILTHMVRWGPPRITPM